MDDPTDLAGRLSSRPDNELTQVVAGNYDITQAILDAHPEMAQDAGFDLFDAEWAKRYWRSILAEVAGLKLTDKVEGWAVGATISGVAKMIIDYYGLPAIALTAAVALAIILLRAATGGGDPKA